MTTPMAGLVDSLAGARPFSCGLTWVLLACLWACAPSETGQGLAAQGAEPALDSVEAVDAPAVAEPAQQGQPETMDPAAQLAAEASRLTDEGHSSQAVTAWREVLAMRARDLGDEHLLTGRAWHNLSYALSEDGRLEESLSAAKRSVEVAASGGVPSPGSAMARTHLAHVAERAGDPALAWAAAEAACADFEATYGKTPMTGEAHELAGRLARAVGDLQGAETHYHWAIAIAEGALGMDDPLRISRPIVGLAGVLASGGAVDAALGLLDHAALLLERGGLQGGTQWAAARAAQLALLEALGERTLAAQLREGLFVSALDQGGGDDVRMATDHALASARLGAVEKALAVLASASQGGDTLSAEASIAILGVAAEIDWLRGRPDLALPAVTKALALAGAGAGSADELRRADPQALWAYLPLHVLHGKVLHALNDERSVEVLFALVDQLRPLVGEDHPLLTEPLLALSAAELGAHGPTVELVDALQMVGNALQRAGIGQQLNLSRRDRQLSLADLSRGWLAAAQTRPSLQAQAFAALDALRERALLPSFAWWIERGAAAQSSSLVELLAVRRKGELGFVSQTQMLALKGREAEALAGVRDEHSMWADVLSPQGAELDQARALLQGPDEALLLTTWAGQTLWAQLVMFDPAQDRQLALGNTATIAPLLARAQAALRDLQSPCDLTALSTVLLKPLWSEFEHCERVLVVADGPLALLPFEALPMPGGSSLGRPWAERCRISYGTSVKRLVHLQQRAAPSDASRAGGLHINQAGRFADGGEPALLTRLRSRFVVEPNTGTSTGDAPVLPMNEKSLWQSEAVESSLKRLSAAGGMSGLRFIEWMVPGWIDTAVPSATALAMGPEADDGRALWERDDGLLQPHELAGLALSVDVLWLPMLELGPVPDAPDLNPQGLFALVAAAWHGGADQVWVSCWSRIGPPRPDFDRLLMQQLRDGDVGQALWETQKAWLSRQSDEPNGEGNHPGLWARTRCYGL